MPHDWPLLLTLIRYKVGLAKLFYHIVRFWFVFTSKREVTELSSDVNDSAFSFVFQNILKPIPNF